MLRADTNVLEEHHAIRWHLPISSHGVATQKTNMDIFTAVRTSDLIPTGCTYCLHYLYCTGSVGCALNCGFWYVWVLIHESELSCEYSFSPNDNTNYELGGSEGEASFYRILDIHGNITTWSCVVRSLPSFPRSTTFACWLIHAPNFNIPVAVSSLISRRWAQITRSTWEQWLHNVRNSPLLYEVKPPQPHIHAHTDELSELYTV